MPIDQQGGVMVEVLITLAISNFAVASIIKHLVHTVSVAAAQAQWCEALINV